MENPPVLLLPGTLCDAQVWAPLMQRLPALDAHMPVLRGAASAAAMAADLLRAAPERFALIGFSLGGIVALEMAAQAPGRLAGLALIAANARPDPPDNAARRRAAVAAAARDGVAAHVARDLWPLYVAAARREDDALRRHVCGMAERLGTEVYAEQSEIAIDRADSRPRLGGIDVPALIVSGAEDVLNPADRQRELASGIPGAAWVELPGTGHMVPLEAPGELAGAILAWLARIRGL